MGDIIKLHCYPRRYIDDKREGVKLLLLHALYLKRKRKKTKGHCLWWTKEEKAFEILQYAFKSLVHIQFIPWSGIIVNSKRDTDVRVLKVYSQSIHSFRKEWFFTNKLLLGYIHWQWIDSFILIKPTLMVTKTPNDIWQDSDSTINSEQQTTVAAKCATSSATPLSKWMPEIPFSFPWLPPDCWPIRSTAVSLCQALWDGVGTSRFRDWWGYWEWGARVGASWNWSSCAIGGVLWCLGLCWLVSLLGFRSVHFPVLWPFSLGAPDASVGLLGFLASWPLLLIATTWVF